MLGERYSPRRRDIGGRASRRRVAIHPARELATSTAHPLSPSARWRRFSRLNPAESLLDAGNGRRVACQLRDHGEPAGAEVQLLKDGEVYAGRRFDTRALALRHADHVRVSLERDGWRA